MPLALARKAAMEGVVRSAIVATASLLVAAAALGSYLAVYRRAVDLHEQVARINVDLPLSTTAIDLRAGQSSRPDFAQRLSRALVAAPLLDELQRAAVEAGVSLSAVSTDVRTPGERTLGRLRLAVVLRGGYPAAKSAMAQVAARFPNLVFQRVSMRRLVTPTDVEARVDVMLPIAPEHRAGDFIPSN